jgi:HlyD family secretion protein
MGGLTAKLRDLWRRSMLHRAMLVAPPVALLLWLGYLSVGQSSGAQYFTAKVEQGDISQVVQATGTINPVVTVQVGSVVSGNIVKINVDFNSKVTQGEIIAEIDPVPFQVKLAQADADYQTAQANVQSLEAQIETSRANVLNAKANIAKAQAALDDAGTQLRRTKELADQGILAAQQKDTAQATYDGALAGLHSAQAQATQADAQLKTTIAQRDQAKAQVLMKKAVVDAARLDLEHCKIRAPSDGTVIARNVDVGQSVAASLQAPVLFNIGQDLTKMLVYANTDEADVGRIKVGAQATFRVDSFPRETFYGRVEQVRMNPTTIQNVVTYNTIVAFDNPQVRLFPGMTAYVSIPVATANNVIKIPNGALRFKTDMSDSQVKALYAKFGIQAGDRGTAAGRMSAPGGAAAGPAPGGNGNSAGANGSGAGAARRRQNGGGAAGANSQRQDTGIVWKLLPNKSLEPVQVGLGVTDFTFTAMNKGSLKPGDELVIGQSSSIGTSTQTPSRSPLGGVPRRF